VAHIRAMRIFLGIMVERSPCLFPRSGWWATRGSGLLYYGKVTAGEGSGGGLVSDWRIRIIRAAFAAIVGKSQRRKDPSSWISWSSTTT